MNFVEPKPNIVVTHSVTTRLQFLAKASQWLFYTTRRKVLYNQSSVSKNFITISEHFKKWKCWLMRWNNCLLVHFSYKHNKAAWCNRTENFGCVVWFTLPVCPGSLKWLARPLSVQLKATHYAGSQQEVCKALSKVKFAKSHLWATRNQGTSWKNILLVLTQWSRKFCSLHMFRYKIECSGQRVKALTSVASASAATWMPWQIGTSQ